MVQHPKFTDVMTQLSNADMVFFSGISLAILPNSDRVELLAKIDKLRNKGVKTAFDSNYRPKLWESISATKEAYLLAYQATDIALVTFDDEQLIWQDKSPQDTIARLHKIGVQIVVVKMGSEGCLISENPNQDPVSIPTTPVTNVVDTTSAGDSFNGGFLARYLTGGSVTQACHHGNALAGLVIQHHGAIIPQSVTDTLSTLIEK
jgi:2-dehydro-3-deoxygluconokinase